MFRTVRTSFVEKYLDPATSMGEVLFGLIMTLTFTLGAGMTIQEEGREGARQLLIATIGCNVAWGVIDGFFYVLGQVFERGRLRRLMQRVRHAPQQAEALGLVAGELDDILGRVTTAEERQGLYERIVGQLRAAEIPRNGIRRNDVMGGIASFWLVFFASLPAAIPFLFITDAHFALRVSNLVLLGLLFWAGYAWARYTTARPAMTGLVFLLCGAALVAMAIALGG
jgi:VIT1/CCC1 family predicted Fe2+/Mn2+ transporter